MGSGDFVLPTTMMMMCLAALWGTRNRSSAVVGMEESLVFRCFRHRQYCRFDKCDGDEGRGVGGGNWMRTFFCICIWGNLI